MQEEQQVKFTTNDLILIQLKDLKENVRDLRAEVKEIRAEVKEVRRELNGRMDKIEEEIKDVRQELNGRMDRLEGKMEKLSSRQDNTLNHGNIMTASVVGVALSVIYFILTH